MGADLGPAVVRIIQAATKDDEPAKRGGSSLRAVLAGAALVGVGRFAATHADRIRELMDPDRVGRDEAVPDEGADESGPEGSEEEFDGAPYDAEPELEEEPEAEAEPEEEPEAEAELEEEPEAEAEPEEEPDAETGGDGPEADAEPDAEDEADANQQAAAETPNAGESRSRRVPGQSFRRRPIRPSARPPKPAGRPERQLVPPRPPSKPGARIGRV